jgi:ribosomal protein L29
MAIIRLSELKDMADSALEAKLLELGIEIARERGLIKSTGKPANSGKYREMRKVIARIHTIFRQRGKGIAGKAKAGKAAQTTAKAAKAPAPAKAPTQAAKKK